MAVEEVAPGSQLICSSGFVGQVFDAVVAADFAVAGGGNGGGARWAGW